MGSRLFTRPSPALVLALAAAAVWIALPIPERTPTGSPVGPAVRSVAEEWPGTTPAEFLGTFFDGTPFTPLLYLDELTVVATAPTPDGERVRLVVYTPGEEARELATLSADDAPGFTAVAADDERIVWTQTVPDAKGVARTGIWTAPAGLAEAEAVRVTADTGDALFTGSQYDLQIAGGSVHWAAGTRGSAPATELRSHPLSGGETTTVTLEGEFAWSAWPYAVSNGGAAGEGVLLADMAAENTTVIPVETGALATCTPVWCRVLALGMAGPGGTELMRTDGSQRRRIADERTSAAVPDPMLLDRFEVLLDVSAADADGQPLLIFDQVSGKTLLVASDARIVRARGATVWWSTGDEETLKWHALNLARLE
ncbi:hypothetical protein AB0I28_20535 [Phytomonospora sp. NPDC050363]|uniref:hypothetical protein n=1 Tax=Phytomonospora sp. NPDC050363 TaxID=3155642 RepID=UPI0033FD8253